MSLLYLHGDNGSKDGNYAIVDRYIYEQIKCYKWYCRESITTNGIKSYYVYGYVPILKIVILSRYIMGTTDPKILIDHKDGNTLNNRVSNLRECNKSQNAANTKIIKGIIPYKGVSLHHSGKYSAKIKYNYRSIHLGCYLTPEEAAQAYDKKAIELFDNFASLNFPRRNYEI